VGDNALAVEVREGTGKGPARRLRQQGRAPAVLYGHGRTPVALSFERKALELILVHSHHGLNTLIDLRGGGSGVAGKTIMIRELQRDPVRGDVLHADMLEVAADEVVHVSVPVHLDGTPRGVTQENGMLDQSLREIELECLPRAIPDELVVDVSELGLGDSLHVSDVPLPEGVELRSDPELSVASVVASTVSEEAEELEEAEAAEAAEAAAAEEPAPEGEDEGEDEGETGSES